MTTNSLETMLNAFYRDDDNEFFNVELAQEIVATYPDRAESHAALARAYYKLDDFDVALLYTRDSLQIDPYCPDALRVRANHLEDNEGKVEEAHRILDAALKQYPNHYGCLLARGYSAVETGEVDLGVKLLLRACQSRPDYQRPMNNLLHFCLEHGQWESLLTAVHKIESHRPLDGEQLYNIGTALYQTGRYNEAITFLDRGRDALGEENAIQHNRALCLEKLVRYQEAVDEWSLLLIREPEWDWPLEGRTRCNRKLGNIDAALTDIKRLNVIDPHNQNARYYEAGIRYDQDRHAIALVHINAILADHPKHASALNLSGLCHHRLHMPTKARADFLRAIEHDETFSAAHYNLAQLELDEERFSEALKHIEIAIALDPEDWQSRSLRAKVLSALNDEKAATQVYSSWLETHRDDGAARSEYAAHLIRHKLWQAALSELERGINPMQPEGYAAWSIGQCHKELDNKAAALEWYKKAKSAYALKSDVASVESCERSIQELNTKKGFFAKLFGE
jgi:tetratricopeptide (TPR) repeat protein